MKSLMKVSAYLILFTLFIACKKDKTDPEPERMWYWDNCKIQTFQLDGLNYAIDYGKDGYPSKVSIQHQHLNTTYVFKYQNDKVIEIIRLDENKINQKVKFDYDQTRLTSVHWFGSVRDPKTSKADTIEMRRFEFYYSSLDKPTSSIVFSYDTRSPNRLLPITTYKYVYDIRGNVSQFEYEIYIGGEATGSKGTVDEYYDDKPATGKFLNLLRFCYFYQDDDSVTALFSTNNWTRSYSARTDSERKLDLAYDEHENAKSRFYGFSNIKWDCN